MLALVTNGSRYDFLQGKNPGDWVVYTQSIIPNQQVHELITLTTKHLLELGLEPTSPGGTATQMS